MDGWMDGGWGVVTSEMSLDFRYRFWFCDISFLGIIMGKKHTHNNEARSTRIAKRQKVKVMHTYSCVHYEMEGRGVVWVAPALDYKGIDSDSLGLFFCMLVSATHHSKRMNRWQQKQQRRLNN